MTKEQIAALIHGADPNLVAWLACDALDQAAEKLVQSDPSRTIIDQAVKITRDRLYDPQLTDPELQLSLMRNLDLKTLGLCYGQTIGTNLTWAARVLTMGDNDRRVIELAAPYLDTGWMRRQAAWLKDVWRVCGDRSIQLIHDGDCPIQLDPPEPQPDPIYLLTPGDIQQTNWLRVRLWLAGMWLAIAIIKIAGMILLMV